MDETLRYSSSRETTVGSSEERAKFEGAVEQGLYDRSLETSQSHSPSTRFSRLSASFQTRSPRLYHAATRIVAYIRGPRPKVNLPGKFPYSGSLAGSAHYPQILYPPLVVRILSEVVNSPSQLSLRSFDSRTRLPHHGFLFSLQQHISSPSPSSCAHSGISLLQALLLNVHLSTGQKTQDAV
jgi:hypothetical protein